MYSTVNQKQISQLSTEKVRNNGPTVLAYVCAFFWIGLVFGITIMWLTSRINATSSNVGSSDNMSFLSFLLTTLPGMLFFGGLTCLVLGWPLFLIAFLCGLVAFVRRKKDNKPSRVKKILLTTAITVAVAVLIIIGGVSIYSMPLG